ncbi:type III secretion system export apparatus subunit SctR [Saccharospirillum salsuginis]|uniref:EscR/YscR/HrcR family type III secretion system export apparatus protein n=1 Tax=Saccharospirillum salsuginis TaxID=418750 RepID=A0A918NKG6_9GAMM|nr:type III secretion system export apparatus subunit SctR [Saccharospirillum salsuginis]GGX75397.1 EscR/YscR/HrcR family type III secretion system export apparatus protein [Saccharospirillum salsuginis]
MEFSGLSPGTIITLVVGLALAPFVAVMVTSFTKIVVVLSLLRNALGLQQTPPNVVINGLAIILSIYVMYPVFIETYDHIGEQTQEMAKEDMTVDTAIELIGYGKQPLKEFLLKHSSEEERAFFLNSIQRILPEERRERVNKDDFIVVIPAFTVSELTSAFQIGFLIFLPFLVIDMIVANILLALGMMMLSPTMVSLPFKLLLFVFISGWTKLIHGLVLTYV